MAPDGTWLATGGSDDTVRILNLAPSAGQVPSDGHPRVARGFRAGFEHRCDRRSAKDADSSPTRLSASRSPSRRMKSISGIPGPTWLCSTCAQTLGHGAARGLHVGTRTAR
ncbi:hypothetical protein [Frankia sp. CiP3]|uniref:hypothetical protein n=1 Tax=Frankia sp. CiP3 TaxID=2880971 RepID=UPI0035B0FA75